LNRLFYGDNLDILWEHIRDDSADLIYLDPPFNSQANYNVLYREPSGQQSEAQVEAFVDTWHWNDSAEQAFDEVIRSSTDAAELMRAIRVVLRESDLMAYLTMMAVRLVELHRVLKPTGTIYLHCDPAASHYLKILIDAVFGMDNYRNEIVWRRTNSHNKTTKQYGPIHDTILFYSKSDNMTFHPGVRPYTRAYIEDRFKSQDSRGRYQTTYLTGPEPRKGESGKPWGGFDPTAAGRHWAIPQSLRGFLPSNGEGMSSHQQLDALLKQDLILFPKKTKGQPMYKQYVVPGVTYPDLRSYQSNTRGVL
jgi:site-specific DNA-methyltransferase (adenine-specific)